MTDWSARVELDKALSLDQVENLHQAIDAGVTVDTERGRTEVHVTISTGTLRQAADEAIRTVGAATKTASIPAQLIRLEVMTLDDVKYIVPDLVGYAGAAEMLGVSRQRVRELDGVVKGTARHPQFPKAVSRPATGPLFDRKQIEEFKAGWQRRTGRPPKGTQ